MVSTAEIATDHLDRNASGERYCEEQFGANGIESRNAENVCILNT